MSTSDEDRSHDSGFVRRHLLLALGAATGIVLAATGVLQSPVANTSPSQQAASPNSLSEDVVARVNDHSITRAEFEQALALQFADGVIPDDDDKQQVLDRLIDEELRVQFAIELNLHRTDGRVRMDLASAITDAAVAGVAEDLFDEQILRDYFAERREYFAARGPIHLRQIWIPIVGGNLGGAFALARDASIMLREQEPFDAVAKRYGSPAPSPIPDKVLEPEALTAFIDPDVIGLALTLQPGEISDPIRSLNGYHVLQVLERQNHDPVSFERCRLDVEAAYWAERAQLALESNAAELRQAASIQRAESL